MADLIPRSRAAYKFKNISEKVKVIIASKEFKLLDNTIEVNDCHKNESVYQHTIRVTDQIKKFLFLRHLETEVVKRAAHSYFNSMVGQYKRSELFLIASYLHDIGKPQTLQVSLEGVTSAPKHEIKGVKIAKKILDNLEFIDEEQKYILDLVTLHSGYTLRFMDFLRSLSAEKLERCLPTVKYIPEIMLFMLADNYVAPVFSPYKHFILHKVLQIKEIYDQGQNKYKKYDQSSAELFDMVREHIRAYSKPWPIESRIFHLNEEVGELNDIYMQFTGMKDRQQDVKDIVIALNDVLFEVLALYDSFGIELYKAVKEELNHDKWK